MRVGNRVRGLVALATLSAAAGTTIATTSGCSSSDVVAARPARGTIGEETYGVLCDRIGAQSLTEDLTGGSYRDVCHRNAAGVFATAVNEAALPTMSAGQGAAGGAATRAHARARIEALVRHRADLIAALDAMIPEGDLVAVHDDVSNAAAACSDHGTRKLSTELARVLAKMSEAYNDGTMPDATRTLGRVMDALKASPEAQVALSHFASRAGYRPQDVALGVARPALAYARIRELANATLAVIGNDIDPYSKNEEGAHVPAPGAAYADLAALTDVAAHELRASTATKTPDRLTFTSDAQLGIDRISRKRTLAEMAMTLLTAADPAFGTGTPRYIVRRDVRGMADLARTVNGAGALPSPFVDRDGDGLADTDAFGQFAIAPGLTVPSPFPTLRAADAIVDDATPRDAYDRALDAPGGAPLYSTIDTGRTFAAALLRELTPLVNPDVDAHHEALMDALAGANVALGRRDGSPASQKTYTTPAGVTSVVRYDAFRTQDSPVLDLAHAALTMAADANIDATLAVGATLLDGHENEVARAAAAGLAVKAVSDATPTAMLPATSTLWDELIDVMAKIAAVTDAHGAPVLMDGLLRGLADPKAATFAGTLATFADHRDELDYNRADINGPAMNVSTGILGGPLARQVDHSKPARGFDRSVFQRFLQLIHDTNGVSVCNRPGARILARMDVPVLGPTDVSIPDSLLVRAFWGKSSFGECEVFKIDDMGAFYLQSIVGQAKYVLRDKQLRDGITINFGVAKVDASITATTVHLLEQSGEITGYQPPGTTDPALRTGFWSPPTSRDLLTRPQWLNRNLFFPNGAGTAPKPARAKAFADALNPDHAGTAVCPKRLVNDPIAPTDPNYTPGGKIYLSDCADGDWLDQRDPHTVFALEQNGFYEALAPIVKPFVDAHREDLLLAVFDALHRHWADTNGDDSDCRLSGAPNAKACTKDGAVHYEPMVAKALSALVPAVRDVLVVLAPPASASAKGPTFYLPCATRNATSSACTGATVDGIRVLATAAKAAVDPSEAKRRGITTRAGKATATWNDGVTVVPQVTPMYLVTDALASVDRAFDTYRNEHPSDGDRLPTFRRARSQLVDQFVGVTTTAAGSRFTSPVLPRIAKVAATTLRQQLWARCPEWPSASCAWAQTGLLADLTETVHGPLVAHGVDVLDALRRDTGARVETERLLTYLLDQNGASDAWVSLLATSADAMQVVQDEPNIVPLFNVVATALEPVSRGAGRADGTGVDAFLTLLGRLTGNAKGAGGTDECGREIDPNQVMTRLMKGAVEPLLLPNKRTTTPFEVVVDTIADVNREAPERPSKDPLAAADYAGIADSVSSFLLDKESGLEQFYAIVRNATR